MPLLALAVALCMTGCPTKSQDQVAANTPQAAPQDQPSDPAAANLAPVSYSAPTSGQAPANSSYQQNAPPPDSNGSYNQSGDEGSDDPGYGVQPVSYAPQPPPPLPDYEQPPAPGDDYLWTPGYWAWGSSGYYWVPGGWVEAPYQGALWTPGYWGYSHNRYGFYRGYWGPHIGYYGGVNYGFGYIGIGYQGGYWGGGHFNYNRSVNNINVSVVHNVYNRSVNEGSRGGARVSYNGGAGGLQVRARPAELAARHETHAAPMRAQIQNEHVASTNRAQFASVNHGRPASAVVSHPLAADRNVRAPVAMQMHNQTETQQPSHQAPQQPHQAAPPQQQRQSPPPPQSHVAPLQPQHQAPPQPHQLQAPQQQHAAPQPQQRPAPQPRQAAPPPRPAAPQLRQAAPQPRPAPPQQRQAPQPQQSKPAPPQHQAAPQRPAEEHPKK